MVSDSDIVVGSPTRGYFNEWLARRKKPIFVGSSKHEPLAVLMDDNEILYNVVYARWASRVQGEVRLEA